MRSNLRCEDRAYNVLCLHLFAALVSCVSNALKNVPDNAVVMT